MLDNIKKFGEAAKAALLYILAPIGFVLIYIYYLVHKDQKLEQELEQAKGDATLNKAEREVTDAKKDADSKESNYNDLRAQYERDKSSK